MAVLSGRGGETAKICERNIIRQIGMKRRRDMGGRAGLWENYGGREEALKMKAKTDIQTAQQKGKAIIQQGEEKIRDVKDKITK
ncbi:MAG: hypothetical protein Q9220_007134 [cf. Caloplaca sp. 1 TL-2023]